MAEQIDQIADLITNRGLDEVKVGRFYKFIMPNVVLVGEGATIKLGAEVQKLGKKRALIVTDRGITSLGLHSTTMSSLEQAGIEVEIFDGVKADPDTEVVEMGLKFAKEISNRVEGYPLIGWRPPHHHYVQFAVQRFILHRYEYHRKNLQ